MKEKDFTVECNVCKQHYVNWTGSTPCCGSLAFIVDGDIFTDNDNYISIVKSLIPLYVLNNIK